MELTLPDALHERIRRIAKKKSEPANEVVRRAIAAGLAVQERRDRHRAIITYARKAADTSEDLDPDLERAGNR